MLLHLSGGYQAQARVRFPITVTPLLEAVFLSFVFVSITIAVAVVLIALLVFRQQRLHVPCFGYRSILLPALFSRPPSDLYNSTVEFYHRALIRRMYLSSMYANQTVHTLPKLLSFSSKDCGGATTTRQSLDHELKPHEFLKACLSSRRNPQKRSRT